MYWHVDPRWQAAQSGGRTTFRTMDERIELVAPYGLVELVEGDEAGVGWHAPIYGRLEPAPTVRVSLSGCTPFWMVAVFGLNTANPIVAVEPAPVWAEAGALAYSLGLRISRAGGTDRILLAHPATGAPHPRRWRLGEFETDAAMLFCRTDQDSRLTRAALVDGARMRHAGGSRIAVTLPVPVPHLHLDLSGDEARLSGPASGARVVVGSQVLPVAVERRSSTRCRAAGRGR
jgi:hypothetical protein